MKKFFLFIVMVISIYACGHKSTSEDTVSEPYISNEFVFNENDTCICNFTYGKYIQIEHNNPATKLVTAEYVRYHDADSTCLIFTRDYIRNLCLSSRCLIQEKQDTIFGYGKVTEICFPEAYLWFAYDEFEEMIVYSAIKFADDIWYTEIYPDGISVTSDVESALWDVLPCISDSILASANIYRIDEKTGVELDHIEDFYVNIWDIARKFYNYPMFDGVKKDNFTIYSNECGLTFVVPAGSNHLKSVYFAGYFIEDSVSLNKLEACFMDKLENIPIRDDIFLESYEQ